MEQDSMGCSILGEMPKPFSLGDGNRSELERDAISSESEIFNRSPRDECFAPYSYFLPNILKTVQIPSINTDRISDLDLETMGSELPKSNPASSGNLRTAIDSDSMYVPQ